MADPARRRATYEDVLAAPRDKVAEIVDGELYLNPRPGVAHAAAATALTEELGPPFKRGRGGPGGWILLAEPELHLGADILVPDLAGWRRERLAVLSNDKPYLELEPDWVCEILSASTSKLDRLRKVPAYGRAGVRHVWLVDPIDRTLEILRREGDSYLIVATCGDDARVRAEPFEAIELDLAILWADVELGPPRAPG